MDRVPLCFINEVLLHLEGEPLHRIPELPSVWGEISDDKPVKHKVILNICVAPNGMTFFCIDHQNSYGYYVIPLTYLHLFTIEVIVLQERQRIGGNYQLLTERIFTLLQEHLQKPHVACCLMFGLQKINDYPLLAQLCITPPRITRIHLKASLPFVIKPLARSIERGTLRHFSCKVPLQITKEIVTFLSTFLTFEKFQYLKLTRAADSPVPYDDLLQGLVDGFANRERSRKSEFYVKSSSEELCEGLVKADMQGTVEFFGAYNCETICVFDTIFAVKYRKCL
uniref:UDENN domain-containing protein n=1 Tax=Steinernema glaseri TaxID=37863 RepID=A0A1I7YHN8_9BILA